MAVINNDCVSVAPEIAGILHDALGHRLDGRTGGSVNGNTFGNGTDAEQVGGFLVEPGDDRDPYVIVNIGTHDNIFVPMSIANAIVDAMVSEAVAS